jgi:hypothetical protein
MEKATQNIGRAANPAADKRKVTADQTPVPDNA